MRRILMLLAVIALFPSPTRAEKGQTNDAGIDFTGSCDWTRVPGGIRYGADGGLATVLNFGAGTIGTQSLGAGTVTSGLVDVTELVADTGNIDTISAGLVGATKVVAAQVRADSLAADKGSVKAFASDYATISNMIATQAATSTLTTGALTAVDAGVTNNLSVGGSLTVAGKISTSSYGVTTPGSAVSHTASGRSTIPPLADGIAITNNLVLPTTIIQSGLETLDTGAAAVICTPLKQGGAFICTAVSGYGTSVTVVGPARFWWILQ